uniref:Growth arrest-specific 1b n=1 Tax=Nothobranchius korthausae TaxID=1143690 RepID=A0A1A8FP67_9TELE
MTSRDIITERAVLLICHVLIVITGFCDSSPNQNQRLVCWKAIFKCQGEPECHYAYDQYLHACASVISGARKKCPSHCISSLVQLNLTRSGPALEECDCATDPVCRSTKLAIEPCLPRTRTTMGCTEARIQCQMDMACSTAMRAYLFHCRKLFGGQRCSDSCRKIIANMRSLPKAQRLDTCVCDGPERNICEFIKLNMNTLCSASADAPAGSGFSDSEGDTEEDYMDQEDYQYPESSSCSTSSQTLLLNTFTILTFTRFI